MWWVAAVHLAFDDAGQLAWRSLSPVMDEPVPACSWFCGLMVVIFGFGRGKQKDLGEVAPTVCPNCHNQVVLHHVRSRKSVRLYFVPVVPYGTDDYLVCPICSHGLQLSKRQLPYLPSMQKATASFGAGRLTEAQYLAAAGQFWRLLGVSPAGQPAPPPASPGASSAGRPPAAADTSAQVTQAVPAQDQPVAADGEASWISQLNQLTQLHDQGVLSDDDYEAAKRRILGQK